MGSPGAAHLQRRQPVRPGRQPAFIARGPAFARADSRLAFLRSLPYRQPGPRAPATAGHPHAGAAPRRPRPGGGVADHHRSGRSAGAARNHQRRLSGFAVGDRCRAGRLFGVQFYQDGLLRPLSAAELSDGTLRYLLLVAALLTPRPPTLMVLNEPETSLHPDLLPALARLIIRASQQCQVWVVSHASRLIAALQQHPECNCIVLEKNFGQTEIVGQGMLDEPAWYWPD
nr:AAA family ATPase [Pseudomonas chlororaphis]